MSRSIEVDLSVQILKAYEDTNLQYTFECVSGRSGHLTSTGRFKITSKDKNHHSRAYNNAPMFYAMFFTKDGQAFHQCPSDKDFPRVRQAHLEEQKHHQKITDGSHGCVRLYEADAKKLYEWAPIGTAVHIW